MKNNETKRTQIIYEFKGSKISHEAKDEHVKHTKKAIIGNFATYLQIWNSEQTIRNPKL